MYIHRMKQVLLLVTLLAVNSLMLAQISVSGFVGEAGEGQPLPFTTVGILRSGQGTITNEDGRFALDQIKPDDLLEFRHVGFESKRITVSAFQKSGKVLLDRVVVQIKPFTVVASDDALYNWLIKCRNTLNSGETHKRKAFLELHTVADGKPTEVIEVYYNADFRSGAISELTYKNGRQSMAKVNNSYFLSLSTSTVFQMFNLIYPDPFLPANPLGLSKRRLRKTFDLSRLSADTAAVLHLAFRPKNETTSAFSGEIWISKQQKAPIEIRLKIKDSRVHPFIPAFSSDSIGNVSMTFIQQFDLKSGLTPLLSRFSYELESFRKVPKRFDPNGNQRVEVKRIATDGVFYFYSSALFVAPFYDFAYAVNDYQRIQSTPFNPTFWESNKVLVKSNRYKESQAFFSKYGMFQNNRLEGQPQFLANTNRFWSDSTFLFYDESLIGRNESLDPSEALSLRSQYNLDVKLYLDLVEVSGQYKPYTSTVFDVFTSFYNLEPDPFTDVFFNIAFDIGEVQRRQLQQELEKRAPINPENSSALFEQHTKALNKALTAFERETQSGRNRKALKNYSERIYNILGVDHFERLNLQLEE